MSQPRSADAERSEPVALRRRDLGPLPELSVLLRAGGALALLILMFATSWYGLSTSVHGSFGAAGSTAAGVWRMLTLTRWLLLAAVVATLASLVLSGRRLSDTAFGLGGLATLALFYRLLINLPDGHAVLDVKLGGYLALVACAALTLGAYEAPSTDSDGAAVRVPAVH